MSVDLKRHLPNLLTVARLGLAIVFLVILSFYNSSEPSSGLLLFGVVVFVVAISTDAIDGHLARRWSVQSVFGRVMDPLCDKILIIGSLMMLAGPGFVTSGPVVDGMVGGQAQLISTTGIKTWMVIVVLWRELLVTGLRSLAERQGVDFSATVSGKVKMILQSAVIPIVLLLIAYADPLEHEWSRIVRDLLVWSMVVVTALSAVPYVLRARSIFGSG